MTQIGQWPPRNEGRGPIRMDGTPSSQDWAGAQRSLNQSGRTFSACGPFGPWVTSNSTFWFSSRDL